MVQTCTSANFRLVYFWINLGRTQTDGGKLTFGLVVPARAGHVRRGHTGSAGHIIREKDTEDARTVV